MTDDDLGPLRFEPIFKNMLWGGARLRTFLDRPSALDDPVGEAWLVSDEGANASQVADGPLAGQTLRVLLATMPERLLGKSRLVDGRFPVLLKFIDARQALSVQVHPNDEQARRAKGTGARGKTEAWVILDAQENSRIYSGLKLGVTERDFRQALSEGRVAETLHSFRPNPGDCVFLRAGTVHAIGQDVLLFEIQQTSDVTYRLYDWDRVDAKTGKPRELHLDEGLACTNFASGPCDPIQSVVESGDDGEVERLVECEHFALWRRRGRGPFPVGARDRGRIVVCVAGDAMLRRNGEEHAVRAGDVLLLPATMGTWECVAPGRDDGPGVRAPGAMIEIDLNSDLGEGAGGDAAILPLVSSANVACGFHAGDPATAFATLSLAARHGVAVGAHPGHPDRANFGRVELDRTAQQVYEDCVYQVGALVGLARAAGVAVRFLKPHGALYHQACRDDRYAEPVVTAACLFELAVVGLPGSRLEALTAGRRPFVAEGFADRRYRPDGTLVPRSEPDAYVTDSGEAVRQLEWLLAERGVRTVCVHGDNPEAVAFVIALRAALLRRGFSIRPFA